MATKPLPPAMKNRAIAALIWELPDPEITKDWPHEARESWFEYARKTVEVVFGPIKRRIEPTVTGTGPALGAMIPQSAIGGVTSVRYVVAPDGTALAGDRPIDPGDIPAGTVLHDYRPQPADDDYSPIMWKTHGAKKLPLPAGVLMRAATEPYAGHAANGSAEATG